LKYTHAVFEYPWLAEIVAWKTKIIISKLKFRNVNKNDTIMIINKVKLNL